MTGGQASRGGHLWDAQRGHTHGRELLVAAGVVEDVVHEEGGQLGLKPGVGQQHQWGQGIPSVPRQLRPQHQQQVAEHHEGLRTRVQAQRQVCPPSPVSHMFPNVPLAPAYLLADAGVHVGQAALAQRAEGGDSGLQALQLLLGRGTRRPLGTWELPQAVLAARPHATRSPGGHQCWAGARAPRGCGSGGR